MVSLVSCLLLSGCTVWQQAAEIASQRGSTRAELDRRQDGFSQAIYNDSARRTAQEVDRPWLAGRAQPLAREVMLPPALRANVDTTLMYADGRTDLPTLAMRITRATGIPVRVRPDALLPSDTFLPRLAVHTDSVPPPFVEDEPFDETPQPLTRLLDTMAARLGIHWAYRDGVIEFYRTQTRIFDVRSLTQSASAQAKLGRSASGGTGGFENTSGTTLQSDAHNTLDAVLAKVEILLTRAGIAVAQPGASASIVVTDTPDALAGVAAYIERENRILTRRVRLMFEEITLVHHDTGAFGLDWNLLYSSARAAASVVSDGGAAQAATLASSVTDGPFEGSRALLSALSEIGTVVRHTRVPVLTLNRRPVTHAVRTTFTYIDQVQSTSVGTVRGDGVQGALPSVSISQKEETVGVFLTLVPDVQADGQILLSVAYDSTVAQPLKTISFGRGDNQVQIQQITVDGNGTVQQIELRPGQPMVISGFDRSRHEHDRRRLDRDAPVLFGGSERAVQERTSTLVVLSAYAEEGY